MFCGRLKYTSIGGFLLEVNHSAVMGHSYIFLQRLGIQCAMISMVQSRVHMVPGVSTAER